MGSRVLRIPVDHIEQDYSPSLNTYVEQGDLFTNNFENVKNGDHTYYLYFEIPENIYRYKLGNDPDIPQRNWRSFGLIAKKNAFLNGSFNYYRKYASKISSFVHYDNSNSERESYDSGFPNHYYFSPIEIVGPANAGWFHISGSNSGSYYEVGDDEIGMYFPVPVSDILHLQTVETDYFVIKATPEYSYSKTDFDDYTIETKNTRYLKWDIDGLYFELLVQDIDIYVDPTYPVNVYARNDRDLTVAWNVTNSDNRSEDLLYVEDSEITITDSNGNSITGTITGSDSYYIFDTSELEGLDVGQCTVEVTVHTNYETSGTATWTFDLTGETNAPEITSVTQNSYPTVTWTASSQIAWELQISNSNGIVYKTGMVPGNARSYTVTELLEDGQYSLEMRCTNIYGIITAWSSYFLELAPTKPDAPENVIVSARADFGISVNCDDMETTGKLLVVRRKDFNSVPEVLGEYNGSFVDYLVGLDDPHEYTIRNYVEGYADGDWIDGVLAYSGVVIRDADNYSNFVHVWMSEDKTINYINADDRSDVLTQCIGRKFPVSELGEWLTVERSFTGYVSNEGFKQLQRMKLNSTHVLLQSKEEYFPCYMLLSDQGEYNDGRIVSFRMTRIDGDK